VKVTPSRRVSREARPGRRRSGRRRLPRLRLRPSPGLLPPRVPRLLLRVRAGDARDLRWRAAGLFGDLAVLLDQEAVRRLVSVDAAGQRSRHLAVGALRAVVIDDVEHHEFGIQTRLSRHGLSPLLFLYRIEVLGPDGSFLRRIEMKSRRRCGAGP
jgi:hypothetical protein